MLDMLKIILSEAKQHVHASVARGDQVDAPWLEMLNSETFQHAVAQCIASKSFSAKALMGCFVAENDISLYLEAVYEHILWRHFPEVGRGALIEGIHGKSMVFMAFFREFHKLGLKMNTEAFLSKFPFQLLREEGLKDLEDETEYRNVLKAFKYDYIYEMMVLNSEIKGFSTVDHISGVHYLAMYIAKQIHARGIPIDLGWVSGAAALHDIGKFGCLPDEVSKVAYYHYYYSDMWFRNRDITYIRQIAVNHSTWDLELANLPIESLVLIYADFRVKGHQDPNWPYPMKFFTLAESFKVILEKLDNVDEQKEKRYKKVYEKLKDFESYLVVNGVKTSWLESENRELPGWYHQEKVLLSVDQIYERLRVTAVSHNVKAMHNFRNEGALSEFLYHAKNLGDAHAMRRHVHLLSQFSRYLTDGQKIQILDFLFELFLHSEEDLRKQASETFGNIISHFDAPYSKYLPPSAPLDAFKSSKSNVLRRYCNAFIQMEDRTDVKVKRIGYALVGAIRIVLTSAKQIESTIQLLITLTTTVVGEENAYFVKALSSIQPQLIQEEMVSQVLPHLIKQLVNQSNQISERRVDALLALRQIAKVYKNPIDLALEAEGLGSLESYNDLVKRRIESYETLVQVYLENGHISTPDEVKKRNIAGILHYVLKGHRQEAFNATIHCCNLLKGHLAQDVRLSVAKAIVVLNNQLGDTEHVEVAMELLRGLEIDHYAFTKYMPQTLGRILVGLSEKHLIEVLDDLKYRIKSGTTSLKVLVLETVAHAINAGASVLAKNPTRSIPIESMLGILTTGLVQEEESVHLAAFQGLTATILDTHLSSLPYRGTLLSLYVKKMATLLKKNVASKAEEVAYAYNFSILYHFMTSYLYEVGNLPCQKMERAAYFQGAFDPVSLGQKGVVMALEQTNTRVYVGLDAYCWQRRTQPSMHRRRLLEMTFADCLQTFLMPRNFSVNFNRPTGLDQLINILPEGRPYLVMGEDALITHPLYKKNLDVVKQWPHFLIPRKNLTSKRHQQSEEIKSKMESVETIELQGYYSNITPDVVRRAIDKQLDLEDVLDALAIAYIKKHHLYRNEPQFKSSLEHKSIDVINVKAISEALESELWSELQIELQRIKSLPEEILDTVRMVVIRDGETSHIIAVGAYRQMTAHEYAVGAKASVIRRDYVDLYPENTALIELLYTKQAGWRDDYTFALQTELLVDAINQGYDFAVYWPQGGQLSTDVLEALRSTGFIELQELRWLLVSLKMPVALILDAQSGLKEDYRQDATLRIGLKRMRTVLMQGIVKAYPKQVLLPFDRGMLYDRLVHLVSNINQPDSDSLYGPSIAVPYGDLFKRWTLPNTITKALHTERVYDDTLSFFDVQASPYHLPVDEQIELIKGFAAPVLLIDDLLDKGLRLQALEKALRVNDIAVDSVVVGIMSGLGLRRISQKGYDVHAGYYLPNLGAWFTESLMYPFIGGDAMSTNGNQVVEYGALQAINRIAPYYTSPEGSQMSPRQYLHLSKVCIENALLFMETLETVYENRHHRTLTISRLSEVFLSPRMPYNGDASLFNPNIKPTTQLKYDLLRLAQLDKLISRL